MRGAVKTLILHVGMHKTGTTALQNSLHGLATAGVRYVDLGHPNHSIPIRASFEQTTDPAMLRILQVRSVEQLAELRRKTLGRLADELAAPGATRFIISGEGIGLLPPGGVAALRDELLKHVDRVEVCAYVRDPVSFSASAFQEYIKGGMATYQVPQPKYRAKFEKFMRSFGADHFVTRVFERDKLRDGSVVSDFCHLWGIPFDPGREAQGNESLSEAAVKLLHLFHRTQPLLRERAAGRWARPRMIREIARHFPGTFRLPPEFRPQAFDARDVDWLRVHCGIDFAPPPSAGAGAAQGDFRRYLEEIDPQVVDSYRELLAHSGVRVRANQSTADLLASHYEACESSPSVRWKRLRSFLRI